MKLIDDWHFVANRAWSMRFLMLAAMLTGAETILPMFMDNPPLPKRVFAVLCFAIVVAAMVARFVAQKRPEASQ